jgi:two-component system, OmpR family, response regulator
MPTDQLLIAEDDVRLSSMYKMVAEECGYEVRIAVNAALFKEMMRDLEPTVITLDLGMPGVNGIELLRFLAERGCRARVLIVSGLRNDIVEAAERFGRESGLNMTGAFRKPFRVSELMKILNEHRGTAT